MRQLTVRGFDDELLGIIKKIADREGISLSRAALRLMRRGAGLTANGPPDNSIGHALDHLAGTWTEEQAREFDQAVAPLSEVDPDMWP